MIKHRSASRTRTRLLLWSGQFSTCKFPMKSVLTDWICSLLSYWLNWILSYWLILLLTALLTDLLWWAHSYLTAWDPNLIWEDLFESSSGDRKLRPSRRKHVSSDILNRLVKLINLKTLKYNDRHSVYPPWASSLPKIFRTDIFCGLITIFSKLWIWHLSS